VRVLAVRAVLLVLLVPLGFYLVPRVIALVQIPDAFQESLDNGHAYNPRIVTIVGHERNTLAALASLDRIDAALVRVRRTDAQVAGQLRALVGQIRTGVQPVLNQTNGEVEDLLDSLDDLETQLSSLAEPVADIRHTVGEDRRDLDRILARAQGIADQVRRARESAGSAADNVAGPGR
jgi:methyl-accepting chemotaxis protein